MHTRLDRVDALRGAVMLLMVVDHVRYFLTDVPFSPTDAARTTPALFATRWITHFCAPVFVLLAGAGARLSQKTPSALARFLAVRGGWLITLELTLARLGWQFNLDYRYTSALVFWALGWSMIALAALVRLPTWASAAVRLALVGLHDAADGVSPEDFGPLSWLWIVLHAPGTIHLGPASFEVVYPLVPWIGVMACGYAFGRLAIPSARNDRALVAFGGAASLAFVALRAIDAYGDPRPWHAQAAPWRTVLAFLDATKYPPSLAFLLMTLGPALAALPALGRVARVVPALVTFGRVPLFFWLLHVPLIHAIAVALSLARYGRVVTWLVANPPAGPPAGYGYSLGVVYAVSVGVVAALYVPCRWFAEVKGRRRYAWLAYL